MRLGRAFRGERKRETEMERRQVGGMIDLRALKIQEPRNREPQKLYITRRVPSVDVAPLANTATNPDEETPLVQLSSLEIVKRVSIPDVRLLFPILKTC